MDAYKSMGELLYVIAAKYTNNGYCINKVYYLTVHVSLQYL